jgi:ABC-type nitrate/sulfonate/bicarbonate transport system substrate-binding protein
MPFRLLAFLIALLPAVAVAQTPPMRTVSVGSIGGLANINTFPLNVAIERGYFKDEGLNVEVVTQASITTICSSLISGAVEIGQCTPNEMIPIDRKGGHLVQFHGMWSFGNPYFVVTKGDISTWQQLKGKTVMLSAPKDLTVYVFERMAKAHGFNLSDFQFAYAGASAARLAALQAGAVEAALLANPTAPLAEANGMHALDVSTKYFPANDFAGGGWVANLPWLNANRAPAVGWIRAINRAVNWIYDPANKAQVIAAIGTSYKINNPGVVQKIFDSVIVPKYFSESGCTFDRAEQGAIKMLVDMQLIPAGTYASGDYAPNTFAEGATGRRCRSR